MGRYNIDGGLINTLYHMIFHARKWIEYNWYWSVKRTVVVSILLFIGVIWLYLEIYVFPELRCYYFKRHTWSRHALARRCIYCGVYKKDWGG